MEILAKLDSLGVFHHVIPRFYQLLSHQVRIDALDSIPLLTRYERRVSIFYVIANRTLDIVLSVILLLIASPVILISVLLIRRESKGRAFFVQERIGRDGRPFRMFKFRTMHDEVSEDAPAPDSPYDARITRIGRYLRRYSLDELPQFLNVLRGEMSVVGPRPLTAQDVDRLGWAGAEHDARFALPPGITGLAQLFAIPGAASSLSLDEVYGRDRSAWLDLQIVAASFTVNILGKSRVKGWLKRHRYATVARQT